MSRTPEPNATLDLRPAVRASAALSLGLLLAVALSGLIASAGGWAALIHGASAAVALPACVVAHLLAIAASAAPSRPDSA
jgi:hypothetical protein